ncbi:MAG TPA: LysR family transcriptional regulator [Usitatibacteraceae bacterium]|nr:LysR family transcriptional regulator [Usitatibacteraceae bacterium]
MSIASRQSKAVPRELTASDLETILAMARGGNLAAAAERLGSDPSTVFRQIQRLEKALGQSLFQRSRSGYRPNDLALALLDHAEKIEGELEAARAAATAREKQISGTVRITTTDVVLYGLVFPNLPAFAAQYPKIQLELRASNDVVNLSQRDADVAIRAVRKPPGHLIGHHIGRAEFAIFGLASQFPGTRVPKDLSGFDWIAIDRAMGQHPVMHWRQRHYPNVVPRYEVDTLVAIGHAIRAGLGIGALSTYRAVHDPELRALTPPLENCSVDLWVLAHPESRHLRRVAAVYEFFAKNLRLPKS